MPSKQRTSSKPSGKQKRELKKNRVVVREKGDDDDDAGGGEKEYADKKVPSSSRLRASASSEKKMKPSGDFVALTTKKKSKKQSSKPRVLYVGSLPHGFYETQMRSYFGQFGDVLRVKVSRNKKTGKSKHYAFVEFKHAEVAAIVAESMDNYLLGTHVLKVKLMRPEDVHPETFKGVKGGAGPQKPSKRAPGRKAQLHTRPRLGRCGAAGRPWAAELVVGIMGGRALRRARSG